MLRSSQFRHHLGRALRIGVACTALALSAVLATGCANKQARPTYAAPTTPEDEAFLKGVGRQPTASTLFAMARMLASQGRLGESEMVLRSCLEKEPRYIPAYNELAELYLRRQRVGDAVEVLLAGLQVEPNHGMLRNNLGMAWLIRGEYENAVEEFARAAAAMPNDARPRANMAAALGLLGRYDEALATFTQIMSPAEAHHNLGVLSAARNDQERAAAEFALAAELGHSVASRTKLAP